jgi:hypothetical protein
MYWREASGAAASAAAICSWLVGIGDTGAGTW